MPAVSEKQRRFMAMELERKRAGKKTKTKMTEKQLHDFASNDHSKENDKEMKKMHKGMK